MSKDYKNIAVLLLAFGGPSSITEVEPFIKSVLSPQAVSSEQIKRSVEKYSRIGGKSPLPKITQLQADALQVNLSEKFSGLKIYVGMQHWHPFIKDTLAQMVKDGIKRGIAIIIAPFNTKASTGSYQKITSQALHEMKSTLQINYIDSWHNNKDFVHLLAREIVKSLSEFKEPKKVHIIFSAHSLPLILLKDDPYVAQLKQTIQSILDITGTLNYTLAYQSKGGKDNDWLGPEVIQVLEKITKEGVKDVLLVPLSFVADNIETLYDIDIVFKQKAKSLGLRFKRIPCFNDSADFIEVLASIISSSLLLKEG